MQLRSYECWVPGLEWSGDTIPACSSGKARYKYLRRLQDAGWDVAFKDIKVRSMGAIHTPRPTEAFDRVARARGVPFAHPKMRVEVDGTPGVIWGVNDGSNFDVLITAGARAGQILNCHPHWHMRYFDGSGNEIPDPVQIAEKGAAA
jgi:hypothetical protein